MTKASVHYQGDQGRQYFAERFTGDQDFGRRYQSRYFITYCGAEKTVLDFGCGDGTILRALPAARRLAVEINPYCLEKIANFNVHLDLPIAVRQTIDDWEDAIADVTISNHALEHVLAPFDMLRGIYRVLRPGGVFVLVTPFDDWRGKGQREWITGDRQNHLYTWNPLNIGNLLTEAGFEVQSSRLISSAWSPKMFWIHRWFGEAGFSAACGLLARVLQRREVLSVAIKRAD
ncbi:MAG: class I SAM-dependent methyltransferase [Candidatus Competibacter denitrificans]